MPRFHIVNTIEATFSLSSCHDIRGGGGSKFLTLAAECLICPGIVWTRPLILTKWLMPSWNSSRSCVSTLAIVH